MYDNTATKFMYKHTNPPRPVIYLGSESWRYIMIMPECLENMMWTGRQKFSHKCAAVCASAYVNFENEKLD